MKKKQGSKKISMLVAASIAGGALLLTKKAMVDFFFNGMICRRRKEALRGEESHGLALSERSLIIRARNWLVQTEGKELYRESTDGLRLHARLISQPDPRHCWAILVHGYGANYKDLPDVAEQFFRHGYNVLLPDNRGHGLSSGRYIGFGWPDRLDLLGWIQRIIAEDPAAKIVLYGLSMGASAVMNCTGENLPENVVACIEDCGYSSIEDIFRHGLHQRYPRLAKMASELLLNQLDRKIQKCCGYSLFAIDCVSQLKKSLVPTLFIHGGKDTVVPVEMALACYDACSAEKELMIIPFAAHAECPLKKGYFERIFQFIERTGLKL